MTCEPRPGAAVIALAPYRHLRVSLEDRAARYLGRAERLGYRLDSAQELRLARARKRRYEAFYSSGEFDGREIFRNPPLEYFLSDCAPEYGHFLRLLDLLGPDGRPRKDDDDD